jgi:hypothetical protein
MSNDNTAVAEYTNTTTDLLAQYGSIESDKEYEDITDIQRQAKAQINSVKDSMKEAIATAHKTHKLLKAKENEACQPLLEIVDKTKRMMGDYDAERKRRERERDAEIAAQALKDASALAQMGEVEAAKATLLYKAPASNFKPSGGGTITRTTYNVELVDIDAVPREYMIADMAMIKKIATATNGKPIAGVKITAVTTTTAKMKG